MMLITAPDQALNGLWQVGIPTGLQRDQGLDASALRLRSSRDSASQATAPGQGRTYSKHRYRSWDRRHVGEAEKAPRSNGPPGTSHHDRVTIVRNIWGAVALEFNECFRAV